MSNIIAIATGAYATNATWGVCNATMAKVSGTAAVNVTAGNLDSANYQPGAVTVDGIALNMATRIASPTGTVTVTLRNTTLGADVAALTINVADLPARTAAIAPGDWHFFQFAAPVLLVALTNYAVRLTSSVGSEVAFYATAANDWNVLLRTTTTGIANGDRVFIGQMYTGAGAATAVTVTMDRNSATAMDAHDISNGGKLIWKTNATSLLVISVLNAGMRIWLGGEVNIGSSGAPQTALGTLQFNSSNSGVKVYGGIFKMGGAPKTYWKTLLAADKASGAGGGTTITVADSIGNDWKNGDSIVIAATTATGTQTEKKSLTADGSTTTLTCGTTTNAHSGTSPTQAEVANLTRWAVLKGNGNDMGHLYIQSGTCDLSWAELTVLGSNTATQRGISTGSDASVSLTIQNCSIHDFTQTGTVGIDASSPALHASATLNVQNNIFYNINTQFFFLAATANTSWIFSGNICMTGAGVVLNDIGGTFQNNTVVGSTSDGVILQETNASIGTISGNTFHSGATSGLNTSSQYGTISTTTIWRNATGLSIGATSPKGSLTFATATIFGNTTTNIDFTSINSSDIYLNSFTVNAGATITSPIGMRFATITANKNIYINNSTFGATTEHSTGDISLLASASPCIFASNTDFHSTVKVANPTNMGYGGFIRSARDGQVAGAFKVWMPYGTVEKETGTVHTSTVSEKLIPNNASSKLESAIKTVACLSGQTPTVSVWINKNTAGANQPRLVVKRNDAAGITVDTVIATYTSGAGSWNQISGALASPVTENCVLEFVVDTDNTNVTIYVADWAASVA